MVLETWSCNDLLRNLVVSSQVSFFHSLYEMELWLQHSPDETHNLSRNGSREKQGLTVNFASIG